MMQFELTSLILTELWPEVERAALRHFEYSLLILIRPTILRAHLNTY